MDGVTVLGLCDLDLSPRQLISILVLNSIHAKLH